MGFTSSEKAIHDYEKIRRLFIYGFSALIYYKIILPDLVELHKTVRDMDKIATSMLKSRGEMIPPSPPVKFNKPFGDPSDLSCVDLNGNFLWILHDITIRPIKYQERM